MGQVLADRLMKVHESIANACARAHRPEKAVQLVVVTKTAPIRDRKSVV
jgi:uncharacterized pyridoxal phosphate-containing UPF0001 family protein